MYKNRRYDNGSIGKYLPRCIVGGLATILLTTNIMGFFGVKNLLDKCSVDKRIQEYGTVEYVKETLEMNRPKNKVLDIIRFACVGLGEELAYKTHKD